MDAGDVFFDWHLLDLLFVVVLAIVWWRLTRISPNRMWVPPGDSRCKYPHYDLGITEWANLVLASLIPVIAYLAMYTILKFADARYLRPFDVLYAILAHLVCIMMGNIVACVLKAQVGRARPDFYAVLGEDAGVETQMPARMTRKEYEEMFRSFPSGHTVTACSGTLFLTLFWMRAIPSTQVTIFVLKLLPLAYAFYVASSRIMEYRHHISDVLGGMTIGFLFPIAFFLGGDSRLFVEQPLP